MSQAILSVASPSISAAPVSRRLISIDALRGLVMAIMLVDHVRETVFLHHQVSDPMDAATTDPALFFTRVASMLCAPVFVFLTGLSAWLYGQSHTRTEVSAFLLKRGLFLMLLEVTLVGFAWSGRLVPTTLWLQVIWAIGISMCVLALLLHLPRYAQIVLGLVIVAGHNLLDGIRLSAGDPGFALWAMLHQRDLITLPGGLMVKTTYPVLPWIGVIVLGYALGPWFARTALPERRQHHLLRLGAGAIAAFLVLRLANIYGDAPWTVLDDPLRTTMSFLALTKYPPSLLFLLLTLGAGLILLAWFERMGDTRALRALALLGGAPMFFYLLHLLVLRAIYTVAVAIWGPNQGEVFGVSSLWAVWAISIGLLIALYPPSRAFAALKQRRRDLTFLRYL